MQRQPTAASAATENIETVIRLEEEDERRTSVWERICVTIGQFVGTLGFVAIQCSFAAAWILANSRGPVSFDPFPYPLLSLVLCAEAVVLSSFVLMRQNRTDLLATRRNHLDLQINLLAEREVTKVLQLLCALSAHLEMPGATAHADEELARETAIDELADELKRKQAAD